MPAGTLGQLHQHLAAQPQSVPRARRAVADFAIAQGAANGHLWAIKPAVSEVATNALIHAARDSDVTTVLALTADICDGKLRVSVCDQGLGMRPRSDSPGVGLGLGIIAALTEHVEITDTNPGVRLTMTFAIT